MGPRGRSLEQTSREYRGGELWSGESRDLGGLSPSSPLVVQAVGWNSGHILGSSRSPYKKWFLSALEKVWKVGNGKEGCNLASEIVRLEPGKESVPCCSPEHLPCLPPPRQRTEWKGTPGAGQTGKNHKDI